MYTQKSAWQYFFVKIYLFCAVLNIAERSLHFDNEGVRHEHISQGSQKTWLNFQESLLASQIKWCPKVKKALLFERIELYKKIGMQQFISLHENFWIIVYKKDNFCANSILLRTFYLPDGIWAKRLICSNNTWFFLESFSFWLKSYFLYLNKTTNKMPISIYCMWQKKINGYFSLGVLQSVLTSFLKKCAKVFCYSCGCYKGLCVNDKNSSFLLSDLPYKRVKLYQKS